ncbi:eukaryotic translation initiation factor 5, partial [Friedmanniomyces endolithicus]
AYDDLGKWIEERAKEEGGVSKVKDVDIYLKAKDLGIETKHRTPAVLAQCLFDDSIVKQLPDRAQMLRKMTSIGDKHEKAFLGGIERF